MLTHPIGFQVKHGDLYLFNSRIINVEKIGAVSGVFYLVGVISLLMMIPFVVRYVQSDFNLSSTIGVLSGLLISVLYLVCGYLLGKSRIWAYYLGLGLLCAVTVLYLLGDSSMFFIIIRLGMIGVTLLYLPKILDIHRHKKALRRFNISRNDVLDL